MSDLGAHVVILGAGHAGGTAAALLRQYGHTGKITLVGEEPIPPYQRPPLSKAWLKGEADADSLALKPLEFYAEHDIDFRPSTRAVKIARADKVVTLQNGETLAYDILILATGARAIKLPVEGADLAGLLELRTAADAEALKAAVGPGKRLAVVGGGYIGLEVAASGRALGAEVVVIEREPRLLARVACEALSDFFRGYHEKNGVTFELGATVAGQAGRLRHHRPPRPGGRGALAVVGPVRPEAPDRRLRLRRGRGSAAGGPGQREVRRLPPEGRSDPVRGGDQLAPGIHDGQAADREPQSGLEGEARRSDGFNERGRRLRRRERESWPRSPTSSTTAPSTSWT